MKLEAFLEEYDETKPLYDRVMHFIKSTIDEACGVHGIPGRVTGRVKDPVSLARKFLAKKSSVDSMSQISDICGVRVVCRSRTQAERMCDVVRREFDVSNEENVAARLGVDQFGYRSIHFDVRIRSDAIGWDSEPLTVYAEIQVRTITDDVWAEVAHDILYKPAHELPIAAKRRVYSLAGLLQVADDHIERIHIDLEKSKQLTPEVLIRFLESRFWRISIREYQADLTREVLKALIPVLPTDYDDVVHRLDEYIEANLSKMNHVLRERENELRHLPYLGQPEAFLIFYLLEHSPLGLVNAWSNRFPESDLRRLAVAWGQPVDDVVDAIS